MATESDRELWQRLGFQNAVRSAAQEDALTPEEREALPLYRLWQRLGLRHLGLADAVRENRAQKGITE